jgi:nocardicin N-oxygenase
MINNQPVPVYPFTAVPGNDLDPVLADLRETAPVCPVRLPYGGETWLVTRYEDVRQVLSDDRFSRAAACGPDVPRMTPQPASGASIVMTDPPEHTRLRRIMSRAFSFRRIERLRPRVTALLDEQLDRLDELGSPADLVEQLALPLPLLVICELLGVPPADRSVFRTWVDPILSSTAYPAEEVREALDKFSYYICDLLDERRAQPGSDLLSDSALLSDLVHAHDEDGRLSEQELVTLAGTLLVAGHENTANQIANSMFALLRAPQRWAQLRSTPRILDSTVEELLRFLAIGSGVSFARIATEDVTISGVAIGKGDPVVVSLPAANRDPRVFSDPETLDLTRPDNPHLAFGPGTHHCLGASLARIELRETLAALGRRFPGLRLAVPAHDVRWKAGLLVRAPIELPVAW